MKPTFTVALFSLLVMYSSASAQDFAGKGFVADLPCQLENVLNTTQGGQSLSLFHCMVEVGPMKATVYRVNVVDHESAISNRDAYYTELIRNYQSMGQSSRLTSYRGQEAVLTKVEVFVEGYPFQQWSLDIIRDSRSYTLVLVTNVGDEENDLARLKAGVAIE